MGLFDNMVKAKEKDLPKPPQPEAPKTPLKIDLGDEVKKEFERLVNILLPIQRGVSRIEAQQPVKNFDERLSHLDEIVGQLQQHCKVITRDIQKKEEIEWSEHYSTLSKINQSIVVEHGRLKPTLLEVVRRRGRDPISDYPEYMGRTNFHPDEVISILKKEREFTDKVAREMENYLHQCWRPGIEAYVNYAKFLEDFILNRKTLDSEFSRSMDKQKYEVYMENLPKGEMEEGNE